MSQPDLLGLLRESRPLAPAEVREHVRQIAARERSAQRTRAFNWRRALLVAVPVAAAAAGASLLLPSGAREPSPSVVAAGSPPTRHGSVGAVRQHALSPVLAISGAGASSAAAIPGAGAAIPAPNPN